MNEKVRNLAVVAAIIGSFVLGGVFVLVTTPGLLVGGARFHGWHGTAVYASIVIGGMVFTELFSNYVHRIIRIENKRDTDRSKVDR